MTNPSKIPRADSSCLAWQSQPNSESYRFGYKELDSNSIVFDVGGYLGEWAQEIHQRYGSTIHIFEPIPRFADQIRQKFKSANNIFVHEFGLGTEDAIVQFNVAAEGTSTFGISGRADSTFNAPIRSIEKFLSDQSITNVDLMKINIEGGEFSLLDQLIKNSKISIFKHLQIQFHEFVSDAIERADALRIKLAESHFPTYSFEFIWEGWTRYDAIEKIEAGRLCADALKIMNQQAFLLNETREILKEVKLEKYLQEVESAKVLNLARQKMTQIEARNHKFLERVKRRLKGIFKG